MTQFNLPTINPATHTGTNLADWLNQWKPALHSSHSGVAAPSYAVEGTLWLDSSNRGTPNFIDVLKIYNGAQWVTVGTAATNSATWVPAGALPLSGGTLTGPLTTGGNITINNPAGIPVLYGGTSLAGAGNDVLVLGRQASGGGQINIFGPSATNANGIDIIAGGPGAPKSLQLTSAGNLLAPGEVHSPAIFGLISDGFYTLAGPVYGSTVITATAGWGNCSISLLNVPSTSVEWRLTLGAYYFRFLNSGNLTRSDGWSAAWNAPSDARIKTNVAPTEVDALDIIGRLPIVQFDITAEAAQAMAPRDIKDQRAEISEPLHVPLGWVAQDVGAVLPHMQTVTHTSIEGLPADLHGVDGLAAIPYLVRAMQQLTARLEALEGGTQP